jgi:hypothetical protein
VKANCLKTGSLPGADGDGLPALVQACPISTLRGAARFRPDFLVGGYALAVLCVALLSVAPAVAMIGFDVEKTFNEGWNAYHAARVAVGDPLYRGDPNRLVDYPFLNFYLIAWLKPLFGNVLMIGRGLDAGAFAMIGVLVAFIIRRFGGGAIDMAYGVACTIGFQAIQANNWIATDEPQMLAEALMLSGLLCYVSGPATTKRLVVCAVF